MNKEQWKKYYRELRLTGQIKNPYIDPSTPCGTDDMILDAAKQRAEDHVIKMICEFPRVIELLRRDELYEKWVWSDYFYNKNKKSRCLFPNLYAVSSYESLIKNLNELKASIDTSIKTLRIANRYKSNSAKKCGINGFGKDFFDILWKKERDLSIKELRDEIKLRQNFVTAVYEYELRDLNNLEEVL